MKNIPSKLVKAKDVIIKWFLIGCNLLLSLFILNLFSGSFLELHTRTSSEKEDGNSKLFIIKQNQSLQDVAARLEEAGLIPSKKNFLQWIIRMNLDRTIQTGRFHIKKDFSLWKIIKKLCNHASSMEKITFPEGLNLRQTFNLLEEYGLDKSKLLLLSRDKAFIESLNIEVSSLEGFLFPDTYFIYYGEDEKKVLKMMVKRFHEIIGSLNIASSVCYQSHGLYTGIILASIIEKEAAYPPDRPHVSSVFWNRLNQNWRLDADTTVHYILNQWQRPLTRQDLKVDSPYNTRRYKGLPPTPICNPGRVSIQAAFFPDKSKDMFFICSGDEVGSSIFSRTHSEHNQIKKKLKKEGKL
ncbi:MAG: endolytic transglycosylase MltG [Candidatus Aureabacteria bacterium]|nr:endolytic transglycosylase MltG [Candidatus Auribacterota bacterium]